MKRFKEIEAPKREEHRMEMVRTVRGVTFVNDAQCHNENMLWYALECIEGPVTLITQADDKTIGTNFTYLRPIFKEKVKMVISVGAQTNKLTVAFGEIVGRIIVANNIFEALFIAKRHSKEDDTVLYSPLMPTKGFEALGNEYKKNVNQINF
jgi:UDP-N-acetylmuramoylalanine--D-glutamate ligase